MDDRPLVSVIVIFLNGARFIEEAVSSVLEQTYDRWELFLVDDGSTDGSTEIAQRYAQERIGRIWYLQHHNHQNRGMSASRNLGLNHAKGDFIAFLDADDVWLPEKLERQVAIMQAQPKAAMVFGSSQHWYSWTGDAVDLPRDYIPAVGEADGLMAPPVFLTRSLKSTARTPCPSNFLVRRETAKGVGGFEEQFRGILSLFEDQAFLAKVFLKSHVFVTRECWDRYRRHEDSCVSTSAREGTKYSAGLKYFSWLKGYLSSQRVEDPELWTALRKKRNRYRYNRVQQHLRRFSGVMKRLAKKTLPASVQRSRQID
jgi:glycosyltransferase involved in cell wall biosynthesis